MTALARRLAAAAAAVAVVRQALVLRSVGRSRRFLTAPDRTGGVGEAPVVHVVLPVLREAPLLDDTVAHFAAMVPADRLVVVTTAREAHQRADHPDAPDTVAAAARLAAAGRCVHLHSPDPHGLKADQLNLAAEQLRPTAGDQAFLLVYDVDSRPPLSSLAALEQAIARWPSAEVFHQSSRFELRPHDSRPATWNRWVVDAGALRANRFVLAYEVPRLRNRLHPNPAKRRLSSLVYTHVTGHGLCVRLSLLARLPFPAHSPLEDMHYSFLLNTHQVPMVPVAALDAAAVPDTLTEQFRQATRWFYGPGRFWTYRRDRRAAPGWRTEALTVSAAAISAEWLSCAVAPLLLLALAARGGRSGRALAAAFAALYTGQLVITDLTLAPGVPTGRRLARLAGYPFNSLLFGWAGVAGAVRLAASRSGAGKTER